MRTQKAKGIDALQKFNSSLNFHSEIKVPSFDVISDDNDMYNVDWPKKVFPLFARPCPIVPRHGFVDSRPINSPQEATSLFAEAKQADSQAELVLMPYIKATHNAIWTPGKLTVGPGNDGATSGKNCVAIKTGNQGPFLNEELVNASDLKAGDVPYLEFVKDSSWYVVQLRGGPNISDLGDDYLPEDVKVKQVVVAEGDLVEWETKAKNFKPGTVVDHRGGALSTHYGVHCNLNKVPILTTREPKVGQTLRNCKCQPQLIKQGWCPKCDGLVAQIPEKDIDEMLNGLSIGINYDISYNEGVKLLLGALHSQSYFGVKESRILGVAVAVALKLAFCACFGEARHKQKLGLARDQVYSKAWADVEESVRKFNEARSKFYQKGWRPGFGGKAWAKCADATAELWNATVRFVRNKTEQDMNQMIESLNKVVNCAHNNGWWFNKFITPHWFDVAMKTPSAALIAVAHHVYRILGERAEVKGLISEVEKSERTGGAAASTDGTTFGSFSITYYHRSKKDRRPWVLTLEDGTERRASCYLRLARQYLKAIGEPITKPREVEVRNAMEAVLKDKPRVSNQAFDKWIIPNIKKADLLAKVLKAQARIKSSVLHIQIVVRGDSYQTRDVPIPQSFAIGRKLKSLAGNSGELYAPLDVKSDGIYAGAVKVVNLNNGAV